MDRRTYLRTASCLPLLGFAGCTSVLGSVTGTEGEYSFGTPVTYQDVRVTPRAYTTTRVITYRTPGSGSTIATPPVGSQFVLVRIAVGNTSGEPRTYPSEAPLGPGTGDILVRYEGSVTADVGSMETLATAFRFDGTSVTPFERALNEAADSSGTLPGGASAEGWAVEIVPSEFTPKRAVLEIAWSGTPDGRIEDVKRSTWRFSSEDFVLPADL